MKVYISVDFEDVYKRQGGNRNSQRAESEEFS